MATATHESGIRYSDCIQVDGGGTIYTSNNWLDRETKLSDAIDLLGGNK